MQQTVCERGRFKMTSRIQFVLLNVFILANIRGALQRPYDNMEDAKAAYKRGEMLDMDSPITLEKVKQRLKDTGVFDWSDPTLSATEQKELEKLFEDVKIIITSRNRQPASAQNMLYSIRVVERAVKKQLKEGQISETLAAKFKWDRNRTPVRVRKSHPYYLDAETGMRVFNV